MTQGWWLVLLVGGMTVVFKSFGPVVFGGRQLPAVLSRFSFGVPAAVLAALVTVLTVGGDRSIRFDARAIGVAVAAVMLAWRRPLWLVLLVSAGITALVRWLA